jgi:hypothetical protein
MDACGIHHFDEAVATYGRLFGAVGRVLTEVVARG